VLLLPICLFNFLDSSFGESCRLFEWSYDSIYAKWTPQKGATLYEIDYTYDVNFASTNETFYAITGLQHGQRYIVTVTALGVFRSVISSFTCAGETGENCVNAVVCVKA